MLASQYGWSKQEIDSHVYFDELIYFSDQIKKRQVDEWKMQLAISSNPHVKNPKELWDVLNAVDRFDNDDGIMDKAGMQLLKDRMRQNPRIVVK